MNTVEAVPSSTRGRYQARKVRILLVDDSAEVRQTLSTLLPELGPFDIVGVAESGAEALELSRSLRPDLVLTDIRMPEMDGLELTRLLKAELNSPRVVVMTVYDNLAYREEAITAGADGYIEKNRIAQRILAEVARIFA